MNQVTFIAIITLLTCCAVSSATQISCPNNYSAFGHRVLCINSTTVYIKRGYWIGANHKNVTVVGFCKFCKSYSSSKLGEYIPFNINKQCSYNRNFSSILCSECENGLHSPINPKRFNCTQNCKPTHIIWFIGGNIIGVFILCSFIFIFDFFPSSGALNASILFAQMVTSTLTLSGQGMIDLSTLISPIVKQLDVAYQFIYGIWALNFTEFFGGFCISPQFQNVDNLLVQYFVALLPLIPVATVLAFSNCNLSQLQSKIERFLVERFCECCHITCDCWRFPWLKNVIRFRKRNSIKTLVASCLLLSYIKFTITTLYLINPVYLYDINGNRTDTVLYYQGNLQYFGHHHIPYGVVAILVFATFILLFPLFLLFCHYDPSLESDIKSRHHNILTRIFLYIILFLNEYVLKQYQKDLRWSKRGHNKPCSRKIFWRFSFGIHDMRWMAGWYFLFRLGLCAASIFSMDFVQQLMIQEFLCVLALFISILFSPYRYWLHNRLEASILLLITLVNLMVLLEYYWVTSSQPLSKLLFGLQYILIYIPAVVIIVYFIYKLVHNYHHDPDQVTDNTNTEIPIFENDRQLQVHSADHASSMAVPEATINHSISRRTRVVQEGCFGKFYRKYLCSCMDDEDGHIAAAHVHRPIRQEATRSTPTMPRRHHRGEQDPLLINADPNTSIDEDSS